MVETSLTTSSKNVEVSKHIPDDIVFSILSKLSIKSLKRFECVRKLWSLLFHDPYFMKMYRNNFLSNNRCNYDDTSLLLHQTIRQGHIDKCILYFLSGGNFENRVKLDWPKAFQEDENDYGFQIMGLASINGILCLRSMKYGNEKLILWNPTTNEFKVIPSSLVVSKPYWWTVSSNHHRVGYDRVKDDYKVIHYTTWTSHDLDESEVSFWEIYSLQTNYWRKIDTNMHLPCRDNEQVYMDGVSHWFSKSHWFSECIDTYLVSFDFNNESFITTPNPSYIDSDFDSFDVLRHLAILNGSVALILNYTETSTFQISILGELGIKESWTKLFIVGPLPFLEYPIAAGKKSKILFRRNDYELVWFDLSTGMIDEIGITTERCNILFHKESILPIG